MHVHSFTELSSNFSMLLEKEIVTLNCFDGDAELH